jgi:hypothetical protein
VLSRIAGVNFADCYQRRETMVLDGLPVTVITYADLKANELATGRPRDAADVDTLEKRRR